MWNLMGYNNEEQDKNTKNLFWSILGYEETQQNEEAQETEEGKTVGEPTEDTLEESQKNDESKKRKEKKKHKKEKSDKKRENQKDKENKRFDSVRSRSPFLSDISSFADYYTSDDEKKNTSEDKNEQNGNTEKENDENYKKEDDELDKSDENQEKENMIEKKEDESDENRNSMQKNMSMVKINVFGSQGEEKLLRSNYNNNMENDKEEECKENEKEEEEESGNSWFVSSIKNIMEPSINKESLSEIISNQYNNFNQANVGLFDMFENLLIKGSNYNSEDDTSNANNYKCSNRPYMIHYEFINHVICSINKELAVNVEMEATKMFKIYNNAYNDFKNEIRFRDEVYEDILNEAEEYATITFDENAKRKKRILKMDFLVLMNVNPDNYKSLIGSQTVITPKMKLEELFKITVA